MSNYDMTFDKKIADDKCFDTIFGAEEDSHLLDLVLKEDSETFGKDVRDPDAVEDGLGKIGGGEGLGNDLGPDHDANKPADDTSDQKVLTTDGKELKANDQLNTSDKAGGTDLKDGTTVNVKDVRPSETELVGNDPIPDEKKIDDATEKFSKIDKFEEAMNNLLDEANGESPAEDSSKGENKEDEASASGSGCKSCKEDAPVEQPEEIPVAPAPVNAPPAVEEPPVAAPAASDVPSDEDILNIGTGAPAEPEFTVDDLDAADVEEAAEPVNTDDVKDKVDPSKVEDGLGKMGAGEGHGNDLGPGHDANKPSDDTSDQTVITKDDKELKQDQLNTADEAGAKAVDGGQVKDTSNVGEDHKSADDSFKEASIEDLEEASVADLESSEADEDDVIDAVKGNKEGGVSVADLTADEDEEDEILSML